MVLQVLNFLVAVGVRFDVPWLCSACAPPFIVLPLPNSVYPADLRRSPARVLTARRHCVLRCCLCGSAVSD
jgi:hypothetical protein